MEVTELNLLEIRAVIADMRLEAESYHLASGVASVPHIKAQLEAESICLRHWATRLAHAIHDN